MNNLKTLLLVIFIFVIFIATFILWRNSLNSPTDFAKPVGTLRTSGNDTLQSNINTFMESQVSEGALGKDNYHCSNILYGYDDRYAYAWVYCSGFTGKSNNLERGTGFSVPTRLEYSQPDFQIIGFKQPFDGNRYVPTFRQLFPQKIYDMDRPSSAELDKLDQEVRNKAKAVLQT